MENCKRQIQNRKCVAKNSTIQLLLVWGESIVINCKVQVKEKHCHVVQIHLPFAVNVTLSLSLHCLLLVIDPEPPHSQ